MRITHVLTHLVPMSRNRKNQRSPRPIGLFICVTAVLLLGVTVADAAQPGSDANVIYSELTSGFQNPPMATRPMVRWWWPGGDVADEEISRELRLMKEAGIGGVEIQSFKFGLNPNPSAEVRARQDSFLSPEWFGHVKHAIDEGKRLGMVVDLTFGSGWPFGGPHIPPELGAEQMDVKVTALDGPSNLQGKIPWFREEEAPKVPGLETAFAAPLTDSKFFKLVAVLAVRGTKPEIRQEDSGNSWTPPFTVVRRPGQIDPASAIVLTDKVAADRTLNWSVPDGHWLLFSFIQAPTGQQVVGGAGKGTQFVLDHLRKEALERHIKAVGEAGKKYFGNEYGRGLRAIFCDSLEVTADNFYWEDGFLTEFKNRRGYDLTPYLPLVKRPGYGDPYLGYPSEPLYDDPQIGDRVRHDYWQTVSDLMIENFYQPLIDWAQENHLKARVQAHGSPTDNLLVYGHADIPETEDLYAEGNYDFLKRAPSGGHLYGRKIVSSESFVWMNHDYETTPEKMKRYGDELLTAGINEIICHGFPYEYADPPDPGWHPFSSQYVPFMTFSSHLNFHNPFWPYLRPLNDYFARIQYLSQTGHFVAPVALYTHVDAPSNYLPTDSNYPLEYSLMADGYNFDFINQDIIINHATVTNHGLRTPGSSYKALVFRNEQRLALPLVEKLREFAQQGLPIVFAEAPPSEEVSFNNYVENGKKIRELVAGMFRGATPENIAEKEELKNGSTLFVKDATRVPTGLMNALGVAPNLRFSSPQPEIFFAEFDHGTTQFFFLRNPKPAAQNLRVGLFGKGVTPEIWDAWTGKIITAPQYVRREGEVQLDLHLDPYGSILLAARSAAATPQLERTDFDKVRLIDGRLMATALRSGQYRATLSNGKTVQVSVTADQFPGVLTLGPNWFFRGVGKDKDGNEYTREYHLADLKDWTLIPDLRTFSGQGHYTLDFDLKPEYLRPGLEVDLDLGEVHDVAEVLINE
ncbi:MAG TPA: glycosyl hydrolase, partial [Terriglobia bacterium]|nr:glycosyl hydrolase [Terriglobia bacterium]